MDHDSKVWTMIQKYGHNSKAWTTIQKHGPHIEKLRCNGMIDRQTRPRPDRENLSKVAAETLGNSSEWTIISTDISKGAVHSFKHMSMLHHSLIPKDQGRSKFEAYIVLTFMTIIP